MPQARAFSVRWENLSRLRKLKAFLMDLGAVITFESCQALRKAHGLLTTLARVKLVSGQLNRTFPRPTPSSSIFCLRLLKPGSTA